MPTMTLPLHAKSIDDNSNNYNNCKLENLATELLINIVTRLPDLLTLDSLLRASPIVFRLFNQYAVEITNAVLSPRSHTHHHTQVLIRIVTLIRCSTLPITNLVDFKRLVTHEAIYHRESQSPTGFAPWKLLVPISPGVLRSIMVTNRRITANALRCLEVLLERFRELRPRYPVDEPVDAPVIRSRYLANGLGAIRSAEFQARDIGPPTWQEEQRVIRAFWRLQLFHDLQAAASQKKLPSWPEADIKALTTCEDPVSLLYELNLLPIDTSWEHRFDIHPEHDELCSIMSYVEEIKNSKLIPESGSGNKNESVIMKTNTNVNKQKRTSDDWLPSIPLEIQRNYPASSPLSDGSDSIEMLSAAAGPSQYRSERENRWGFVYGAVEETYTPHMGGFERFGKYGFAFWDTRRMREGAFKAPPAVDGDEVGVGEQMGVYFYYFVWHSILDSDGSGGGKADSEDA